LLTIRTQSQTELLVAARTAYRGGHWDVSYSGFSRASALAPLAIDDLDAMATSAWRLGHASEAVRIAELVYRRLVRSDLNAAAIKAAELGLAWSWRGDLNTGQAWLDQARQLLAGASDTPALAYLTYLQTVVTLHDDDMANTQSHPQSAGRVLAALTGRGGTE